MKLLLVGLFCVVVIVGGNIYVHNLVGLTSTNKTIVKVISFGVIAFVMAMFAMGDEERKIIAGNKAAKEGKQKRCSLCGQTVSQNEDLCVQCRSAH